MKEIFKTDIKEKKEFVVEGDILKVLKDYGNNWYIYERHHQFSDGEFHLLGYELVKGVKRKNPDGSIVYVYPNSEQFGKYGWYYPVGLGLDYVEKKYAEKSNLY